MPYSASAGAKASPESFSITRPYPPRAALPSVIRELPSGQPSLGALAKLVPDEAADGNFLADLRRNLVQELLHRLPAVLHERLVQEHDRGEEGVHLPVDDPVDHVIGFAGLARLRLEDLAFELDLLGGNLVAGDEPRRRRTRDVQAQILRQLPELVGVRDEVRLAVHLGEDADGVVEM